MRDIGQGGLPVKRSCAALFKVLLFGSSLLVYKLCTDVKRMRWSSVPGQHDEHSFF